MHEFDYKNHKINPNQFEAKTENYKTFYDWLHSVIQPWNLSDKLINKIDLCAEEIFVNISLYAYSEKTGTIEVSINKKDNKIILKFTDTGFAYNPLEKPDPDITLPPEQRQPGGLGIYMIKQAAENVSYERNDNKNILTMTFNCNE